MKKSRKRITSEELARLSAHLDFVKPPDFIETDLDQLIEKLNDAQYLFSQGGDIHRRLGVIVTLQWMLYYFRSQFHDVVASDRLLIPLDHLLQTVENSNPKHGRWLFSSSNTEGGTSLTSDDANFRVFCCVLVDIYLRKGADADPDAAADLVAKCLTKNGFSQQRRTGAGNLVKITKSTIKGWRKEHVALFNATSQPRSGVRDLKDWLAPFFVMAIDPQLGLPRVPSDHKEFVRWAVDNVAPIAFGHLRAREE